MSASALACARASAVGLWPAALRPERARLSVRPSRRPSPRNAARAGVSDTPLPNSARALQQRKKIKILAIGASSDCGARHGARRQPAAARAASWSAPSRASTSRSSIAAFPASWPRRPASGSRSRWRSTIPTSCSGKSAPTTPSRRCPSKHFSCRSATRCAGSRQHNVDVILVGLHYMKQLAKNEHYQAIRASLQRIASAENVLRIGRYEAMEVLSRTMRENGQPDPEDFGPSGGRLQLHGAIYCTHHYGGCFCPGAENQSCGCPVPRSCTGARADSGSRAGRAEIGSAHPRCAALKPADTASCSEQNQRSPRAFCTRTRS